MLAFILLEAKLFTPVAAWRGETTPPLFGHGFQGGPKRRAELLDFAASHGLTIEWHNSWEPSK